MPVGPTPLPVADILPDAGSGTGEFLNGAALLNLDDAVAVVGIDRRDDGRRVDRDHGSGGEGRRKRRGHEL